MPQSLEPQTAFRIMATSIADWCLQRLSSASAADRDSVVLNDVTLLCFLSRFVPYFPPLCLRQRLPELGQLAFPSKLLRRFLRGCVVFTAHGLVTAPASVYVGAETEMIWMNRIVARVMSGAVVREEGRLQAAAAQLIAGKRDIISSAASGDVADVLSYLIADVNWVKKCNFYQFTALHGAAENDHPDVCELLIASKADVNEKNSDQDTALHRAARSGHTAVCELLIASKADVNAKNGDQSTAMHYAAVNGHVEACELLIASKADVTLTNSRGETTLNCAIERKELDVVALLRSVGAAE